MPLYVDGRNVQQVCDAQLGPHDRELCSAGADAAKLRTLKLMMTLRLKQPLAFSAEFGSGGSQLRSFQRTSFMDVGFYSMVTCKSPLGALKTSSAPIDFGFTDLGRCLL